MQETGQNATFQRNSILAYCSFSIFLKKLTSVRVLAVEKNRNAANGVIWGFLSFLQYAFEIEVKTLPS